MRASAGGYYVELMRMYEYLGIMLHPLRFLFVFAKATATTSQRAGNDTIGSDPGSYFVHPSNLHQIPPPWPGNRSVVAHIFEIMYLIACHFWFTMACFTVQPLSGYAAAESLEEYIKRIHLPRRYVSQYLLPLMASVSTCSHNQLLSFPASDIVNYKKLSQGQLHYAVCGGVTQVQSKLVAGISDIRLATRVLQVVPQSKGVLVRWQSKGDVSEELFDRVVLAVSPDVARSIFDPLASILSKIPTLQVESSVNAPVTGSCCILDDPDRATRCMHHRGDALPAQTITLRTQFSAGGSRTEALHAMPSGIVVSTCPLDEAVESKKQLKVAKFTRTLRTLKSRALIESIMGRSEQASGWVNGEDNVWLVGAWCWDGMVLLEGCVVSAMKVADDFGVSIPWRA